METLAPAAAVAVGEYVSAREISRQTGWSVRQVADFSRRGLIGTKNPVAGLPGVVKYSRSDAAALLRSTIKPASRLEEVLGHSPAACEPSTA